MGSVRRFAAYWALLVLFFVNIIGYLDRQILVLVVEPIKADLGLTDAQVGLVHGAAFITTYTVAGLLIGPLIDRWNRRNLLFICVLFWSTATALAAFARSGMELFVFRMGVGLGEAALVPIALSLLSDFFSEEKRGRAMGFFMTGAYIGAGASLVLAGSLLPVLSTASDWLASHDWAMSAWRLLMIAVWIPGLIAAALLLTLKNPGRTEMKANAYGPGFGFWFNRWRTYLPHHLGFALLAFASFGLHAWAPSALLREFDLPASSVGKLYGLTVILSGIAGAFLGGWLGDRRARQASRTTAVYPLMAIAFIGIVCALLLDTFTLTVLSYGLINLGLSAALVVGISSVSDIAEASVRGRTAAIYLLFAGILGMAGAPAIVGFLSDMLQPALSLRAILAGSMFLACIAGLVLIACAKVNSVEKRVPATRLRSD